jgi:hypothetical protein
MMPQLLYLGNKRAVTNRDNCGFSWRGFTLWSVKYKASGAVALEVKNVGILASRQLTS